MNREQWWASGFDPTPRPVPTVGPKGPAGNSGVRRDPVLTALKWIGIVMLLMCVAPFYAMAVFLRTFVRI